MTAKKSNEFTVLYAQLMPSKGVIRADKYRVIDGALFFYNGKDELIKVIAAGHWITVEG